MEDMHGILKALDSSSIGSVLATVVKVTGSAYKKEGATMLFKPDGARIGLLSAGCLEEDLEERLKNSRELCGKVVYDMRADNEFSWGEGSGCNGVIHVWTEKIDEQYKKHLLQLKKVLCGGQSVLMLKKLGTKPGYLFVPEDGETFGCWENSVPDECLETDRGLVFSEVLGSDVYAQRIYPKRRLVVFGAGPDARPLVSFAAAAGFSVAITDWRPAFCTQDHFPAAEKRMIGFPGEVLEEIKLRKDDCVVLMTHNFKRDQELLRELKEKEVRYLGVLGSKKRTSRLLGTKEIPSCITSPAGLDIQACGAEEIAISIVAQLIQVSHSVSQKEVTYK